MKIKYSKYIELTMAVLALVYYDLPQKEKYDEDRKRIISLFTEMLVLLIDDEFNVPVEFIDYYSAVIYNDKSRLEDVVDIIKKKI